MLVFCDPLSAVMQETSGLCGMCQAITVRLFEWAIFHHPYCPFKNSYPARLNIRELIITILHAYGNACNNEASSEASSRKVDKHIARLYIYDTCGESRTYGITSADVYMHHGPKAHNKGIGAPE